MSPSVPNHVIIGTNMERSAPGHVRMHSWQNPSINLSIHPPLHLVLLASSETSWHHLIKDKRASSSLHLVHDHTTGSNKCIIICYVTSSFVHFTVCGSHHRGGKYKEGQITPDLHYRSLPHISHQLDISHQFDITLQRGETTNHQNHLTTCSGGSSCIILDHQLVSANTHTYIDTPILTTNPQTLMKMTYNPSHHYTINAPTSQHTTHKNSTHPQSLHSTLRLNVKSEVAPYSRSTCYSLVHSRFLFVIALVTNQESFSSDCM